MTGPCQRTGPRRPREECRAAAAAGPLPLAGRSWPTGGCGGFLGWGLPSCINTRSECSTRAGPTFRHLEDAAQAVAANRPRTEPTARLEMVGNVVPNMLRFEPPRTVEPVVREIGPAAAHFGAAAPPR